MSSSSPYSPPPDIANEQFGINKVKVQPINLLKRAYALIEGQYWLFLGIIVVGMLVGSAVPFGLIMGPVLVGIFLCYIQRERFRQVEFATLFKGFDQFVDSFVAFLVIFAVSLVVMVPFMIALFAIMIGPIIAANANAGNGPPPPPEFPVAILVLYPLMIIANMAITLPFMFTFQLIADRKYKAIPAVKVSARGVVKNLGGIIWFMFVIGVISMIAAMMCYVPAILLMPLSFGAVFILYRDIYGATADPTIPTDPNAVASGQFG